MRTLYSWLVVGLVVLVNNPLSRAQNGLPPELDDCDCVPYYLCVNGTIIDDGTNLIDIRIDSDSQCPGSLDLCCNKPDQISPDLFTTGTPTPQARASCGQRNPRGLGFTITGGSDGESQFGEFPWMVALMKVEAIDGTDQQLIIYLCGGSLIHPQVVLTAAHCVNGKSPEELKVRAGEWDTQTKDELYQHQDRAGKQIIMHEGFFAGNLYNDIALLILDNPVTIRPNVGTVCLPPQGEVFDHRTCFASGWGKNVFGREGRYQVIMKKVELPVVPRADCLSSLRTTRLGAYFNLHHSFICAGGEGKDTCKGDGGSPLVCPMANDPLHYQQAGIVAWGIGCGETPGVYVNIANFRKWIDNHMTNNNFGTESYAS